MEEEENFGVEKSVLFPETNSGNLRTSAFICGSMNLILHGICG
jgi:hypothetical protein